jgi:hypothetical protein
MSEAAGASSDFDEFWLHFLSSHRRGSTRWAHVAGVTLGVAGVAAALGTRKLWPLVLGGGALAVLAVGAHPLLEGNRAENLGRPLWAARALGRMWVRQVTGAIDTDLAKLAGRPQA